MRHFVVSTGLSLNSFFSKSVLKLRVNFGLQNSYMEKQLVYHITYWEEDKIIDRTLVDELNAELIWKRYKEFGHTRTDKTTFEVKETFEEA